MVDEKRKRILSIALEVFFKHGFKRVAMNEIAEAAGISRPGLYLYFKSKEEIFTAAMLQFADSSIEEILSGLDDKKDMEAKIAFAFEVWIVSRFDSNLASPEAKEINDSTTGFARDAFETRFAKFESILVTILKSHSKSTGMKKSLSSEKIAHILASSVHGFKMVAKNGAELRKMIHDLLSLVLAV